MEIHVMHRQGKSIKAISRELRGQPQHRSAVSAIKVHSASAPMSPARIIVSASVSGGSKSANSVCRSLRMWGFIVVRAVSAPKRNTR